MQNKTKVVVASVAVALAGMAAIGATSASATQTPPRTAHTVSVATADKDTLQQGDQTTPDVPGAPDTEEAPQTGSAADTKDANGASESASESAGESAAQSDGPGGHADGPGNVDHQSQGAE